MPEKQTLKRARAKLRRGDTPNTAAGEFVREEIEHVREGKHGARSTKQAIAIGLSKARRAGIPLPAPRASASKRTKRQAKTDKRAAKHPHEPSAKRSRATLAALKKEPHRTASHAALARHAKRVAPQAARTRKANARKPAKRAVSARRTAAKKRRAK